MKLLDKYKEKLRVKLRKWLGIPTIEQNTYTALNDLDMIKSLIKCGVDVHSHQNHSSWAVVCLAGKSEYVNFVHLNDKSAKDIKDFLRNFRERNTLMDMPIPSIPREVFWR
jgi:hypothetical protein